MKKIYVILVIILFTTSCNTYKWQRKRYYKSDRTKNWNNYNDPKTKQQQQQELDKYYIKE